MRETFAKYKRIFCGCIIGVGVLVVAGTMWYASRSKSQPSVFEAVWSKSNDLRVGISEQAAVDFTVVQDVMRYYACEDFDKFFEYYLPPRGESAERIAKHGIQKARKRTMPDVDCSTAVHVLGYSTPPVEFVRLTIALSPLDTEVKRLVKLVDASGVTQEERHLWKKFAFIEVSIGRYTLLTVWYHDNSRLWLINFMDKQEAEEYLNSPLYRVLRANRKHKD